MRCDLVSFAQFKKREKHPWRSVTFSKVADQSVFKIVQMVPNRAKHQILLFRAFQGKPLLAEFYRYHIKRVSGETHIKFSLRSAPLKTYLTISKKAVDKLCNFRKYLN